MRPVNNDPQIATPTLIDSWGPLANYLTALVVSIVRELREHAFLINRTSVDEVLKANLPNAASNKGRLIMVSDEAGGYVPAFSDGTSWRRVTDRAVVS